jgi:hypothetical protein
MAKQRNTTTGANAGFATDPVTAPGQSQGAGAQGAGANQGATASGQSGGVTEQATQRVQSGINSGKSRAAETLGSVAQTLLQSTQQLRDQNQAGAGQYVERAAEQVQRLSDYLQNTEVSEIVDNVERVARRRPAAFLGGAFALGLLGARFLKSSRRGEFQRQRESGDSFGADSSFTPRYTSDRDVTGALGGAADVRPASTIGLTGAAGSTAGTTGTTGTSGTAGTTRGSTGRSGQTGSASSLGQGSTSYGASSSDPDGIDRS